MKGRVKPKPTLGGVVGFHDHIGNQKTVLKHAPLNVQPQMATHRAARTIGHHQPIGLDVKRAVGRFDREGGDIRRGRDRRDFVLPSNVCPQGQGPGDQHFLDVVLLQIDHARPFVARIGHQVELVHLVLL